MADPRLGRCHGDRQRVRGRDRREAGLGSRGGGDRYAELEINALVFACVISDDLHARRERWDMSYLVVQGDAMDAAAPVVARLTGT